MPRLGVSQKVDSKGKRALLRHIDINPEDSLTVFGMPFKSEK